MRIMIRPTVFLVILGLVSGCAGWSGAAREKGPAPVAPAVRTEKPLPPRTPAWVIGKGHPGFPASRYLTGVGVSGENAVSANESARSELAKSLKVKISSVMRDVSTEESTRLRLVVETQVDTILEGVEIKDGWYDAAKRVYYSFAVLRRELAAAAIRDRIAGIESRLPEIMRQGREHEAAGEVVGALSHYLFGYRAALPLLPLKSARRVIIRASEIPGGGALGARDFADRIDEVVHSLDLSVGSGDGQVVQSIGGLPEPLAVRVSFKGKPVHGIPVVFQFDRGDGELEAKKTSAADGTAQTTVRNIRDLEKKNQQVSARFDYDQIASRLQVGPAEKFLVPLRGARTVFHFSVKTPEWGPGKTLAWKRGVTDMVNQVIRNIPPGGSPTVGIVEFRDLRLNRVVPFSRILREDFKTILVQAENLTVKEAPPPAENQSLGDVAKSAGLDFYISGSYRMENRGLELRAQLTETATGHILSSARARIARSEIYPGDLAALENPALQGKPFAGGYDADLNQLIFARPSHPAFNVKVWVDQTDYRIGDTITFNIKSDRDCYLTLLDIGADGNITVIFPNKYRRDNFVEAGIVYQIPSPGYGFRFDVQGPPGLERIKAVATLTPGSPIELDLEQGFHSIERGTTRGNRDIRVMAERFSPDTATAWAQAYTEIFIYEREKTYFRGSRKVPLVLKPKKPIDMLGTLGKEEKLE
ncbi:MAG: DUF4384 domain-containing protein [Nitrospinales bacterium]